MMAAKHFRAAGIVAVWAIGVVGARAGEDPTGYWATEKHESQIKVSRCAGDGICGTIFWMRDPNDAKGNPRLDRENEDEAKRKRPILGLQLITMKPDDDHWKGSIYNPQNGKTYSATFKLVGKNEAEVEGCVAYVLCGGQKWTREEPRQVSTVAHGARPATPASAPAPTPAE